jgi:hypothetical protein
MKTTFTTLGLMLMFIQTTIAQTLTYANYSQSLTQTVSLKIADNASFNSNLLTTTGVNANWDASALTVKPGTPTVNLSYYTSSATPQGSQYPNSNYCEYDPALVSVMSYNYYGISADSVVGWGNYEANASHEVYQDPDKRLIFPFTFGQSFTDTYAKTNYSNATTVSSNQTGARTVTFAGYGTLKLPQGTFADVAMISEVRTNSLGPNSFYYNWIRVSDGKRLMFRSENDGSVTTVWSTETATTGLVEKTDHATIGIYPNPLTRENSTIVIQSAETMNATRMDLFDYAGKLICSLPVNRNKVVFENELSVAGIYFYHLSNPTHTVASGKLIVE